MEVGDYVRTKDGKIAKIINIEKDEDNNKKIFIFDKEIIPYYEFTTDNCYKEDADKYIIKFSKSIIDLIEVGDYVNGYKIVGIGELTNGPEAGTKVIDYYIEKTDALYYLKNEEIKSIVTCEMFENIEYRMGD